jgi:fructose-bisphosphate aldolase class II
LLAGNLEMTLGAVRAAEAVAAPLILAFNEAVTPQVPMDLALPMVVAAAEGARVPVATILDHGMTPEAVAAAIRLGASSVMFDGSSLPFEENIRRTRAVVEMAHAAGVCVEGELGAVGGSSIELGAGADHASTLTDPDRVAEYVARTGVDILAVSFGNVHGIYGAAPQMDLERVRRSAAAVAVPLAMHGASGLPEADYAPIVASGISKINYYTAMARVVSHHLRDLLAAAPEEELVYHRVIAATVEEFCAQTQRLLTLLGAAGQAEDAAQRISA